MDETRVTPAPKTRKKGLSLAEMASMLQVTPQVMTYYESKGWVIRHPDDRTVDADATIAMIAANKSPLAGGNRDRDADDDPNLNEARLRKEIALAEKAEIEVAKLRGLLIPLDIARTIYTSPVIAARQNLNSLANRSAPLVIGQTDLALVREIIQREVDSALKDLSEIPPEVVIDG